jgi:hypothetical protein
MNRYASGGKHGFWWQTTTAKWFWRAKTLRAAVAFGFGLRCRGRHSPLRGCSARSASPKAKIHSRSITHNFQTGSKPGMAPGKVKIAIFGDSVMFCGHY